MFPKGANMKDPNQNMFGRLSLGSAVSNNCASPSVCSSLAAAQLRLHPSHPQDHWTKSVACFHKPLLISRSSSISVGLPPNKKRYPASSHGRSPSPKMPLMDVCLHPHAPNLPPAGPLKVVHMATWHSYRGSLRGNCSTEKREGAGERSGIRTLNSPAANHSSRR